MMKTQIENLEKIFHLDSKNRIIMKLSIVFEQDRE